MQNNEKVEPIIDTKQLCVGTVIVYRLRPDQHPTHPEKRWRGKITEIFTGRKYLLDVVWVEILEESFEGDTETVLVEQIVEIESIGSSECKVKQNSFDN